MLQHWKFQALKRLTVMLKTIKAQRIDLFLCLSRLFCQNNEYKNLELIQNGVNLEKYITVKILKVFQFQPLNEKLNFRWEKMKNLSTKEFREQALSQSAQQGMNPGTKYIETAFSIEFIYEKSSFLLNIIY